MLTEAAWAWPLLRGLAAAAVFVVLLLLARRRWRGGDGGPGDVGLD